MTDYQIEGIPDEPGVYESEQFPLGDEGHDYSPYYKYEDGAFFEGERGDKFAFEIRRRDRALVLGPFRKIGELEAS